MSRKRQTRRCIAYGMLLFLFMVLMWMMMPGDLGDNEADLAKVAVASFCLALGAFIAEQGVGDHSERKAGGANDP